MLNKNLLSILTVSIFSNTALADNISAKGIPVVSDLSVTLGLYSAFESGFSNQSNLQKAEKKISANKEGFAFYNDAALFATISNKANGIEYGGKIILVPTAKRKAGPSYNGSHIFVKGTYGLIELGSPIPVAANMMISDGGIPKKYIKDSPAHLEQGHKHGPSFLTGDGHFLGDDIVASLENVKYSNEPPRTINYYTPKFTLGSTSSFQIGISYTPDSANTGAGKLGDSSKASEKKLIADGQDADTISRFAIDKSVKDAITVGISLEHEFSDNITLNLALTGERGKTVGKGIHRTAERKVTGINTSEVQEQQYKYKLADLNSYNVGAELVIDNITFNACYGNLGKSFTTPEFHRVGTKSHYYNAGIAYKWDKTTTKLSYFASEQYKNKVRAVKLNMTHTLAPGFKPYIEISNFTLRGKPENRPDLPSKNTKGTVALLGVKLTL
jgi:hypothetical protein